MTFYNHIESVRSMAIDLTDGRKWRGASDKAAVFDALDAARREYMHLSDENAKLRELAHLVAEYVSTDQCEGCVTKRVCNAGELDMCWIRKAILEKLRELGVEVD